MPSIGLSAYALITRWTSSFMGGFLMAGIAGIFFAIPGLALAVSTMFMLLMCGLILYETSNLIHGGETNYIWATIGLYVTIYNLFTSLLHILGVFGGDD